MASSPLVPNCCNLASFSRRQQKCFLESLWGRGMNPAHVYLCILIHVLAFRRWTWRVTISLKSFSLGRLLGVSMSPGPRRRGACGLCSFARNCKPEASQVWPLPVKRGNVFTFSWQEGFPWRAGHGLSADAAELGDRCGWRGFMIPPRAAGASGIFPFRFTPELQITLDGFMVH